MAQQPIGLLPQFLRLIVMIATPCWFSDTDLQRLIAVYYSDFETFFGRSRDRRSGYVQYVHSLLPSELREDMNLVAMEDFGIDRALERFTSIEFQNLLNQEYNFAFFVQRTDYSSSSKRLAKDLKDYIQQLEGDS